MIIRTIVVMDHDIPRDAFPEDTDPIAFHLDQIKNYEVVIDEMMDQATNVTITASEVIGNE